MGATHHPELVIVIVAAYLLLMGCTHPTHFRHARKHNPNSYDTLLAWGCYLLLFAIGLF